MSEEEKKAIEQLKKVTYNNDYYSIDLHTVFGFTTWNYCFETILNLIEKQQEEIEELKNTELDYTTIYINGKFDGEKKYKDKIREKIKELEQCKKEELQNDDELGNHSMKWAIADYVIETLQELLEEK